MCVCICVEIQIQTIKLLDQVRNVIPPIRLSKNLLNFQADLILR